MKTSIIFLIILTNVFFSCTEKQQNQIVITPDNFIKSPALLSDFVNDINYIPLSTKIPIRNIRAFDFFDNLIFIGAVSEGLLVFNKDGSFNKQIGKRGKGPGEYYSVNSFSIDQKNQLIYILDAGRQAKVIVYSLDGEFKYEFSNNMLNGVFQKIAYNNGKLYLFEIIIAGNANYNWVEISTEGKLISTKTNSVTPIETMATMMINPVYQFEQGIGFWNQYNDTIFRIENGKHTARYLFAQGKHRLPHNNTIDFNEFFTIKNILESKHFLWIEEFKRSKNNLIIVDKQSRESTLIENSAREEADLSGLFNDLDGGINFMPNAYFINEEIEYLVSWPDAYQVKAFVDSEAFKNSTPKYPEKKKELKKLANGLNENDNPVLMLVKLKD
jgi:hypothetical protein